MTAFLPRGRDVGRAIFERAAFGSLSLVVFTIPWEDSLVLPGVGTISRFLGILAIAVGALSVLRRGGLALKRPAAYLVPFFLFGLWATLSVVWAPNQDAAIRYSFTMVQLVALAWLMWQLCRTSADRTTIMQAYVLGAMVSVVNTTIQFMTGQTFLDANEERFAASGFNPNYLASAFAIAIPMAWHLATEARRRWWQILNYFAIPALLFAIILTGSRGGFIIAAIALTIIPLTFRRLAPSSQSLIVIALLVFGLLGYRLAPVFEHSLSRGIERISEIPEQFETADLTGRADIWIAGWQLFRDNPLVGVGAGGFDSAVRPYLGREKSAHNAFLNVAAEGGIVAALLFTTTLALIGLPFALNARGDSVVYVVLYVTVLVCLVPSTLEIGKEIWVALALVASRRAFVMGRQLRGYQPLRRGPLRQSSLTSTKVNS